MKVVDGFPANKLPKELLGDDIPPDARVRVIIQTERTRDLDALLGAIEGAADEAERNGLTAAVLEQIVDQAREDYRQRGARRR